MSPDWHFIKIGDLGRVVTGKTPPSARPECFGSDYPFITPSDIGSDTRRVKTARYLSTVGKASMPNYLLPEKTICVVCIGATIGKICMTHTSSFTNQQINSIIVDTRRFDPHFVYYAMRKIGPSLLGLASGAATPIINKSSFSDVEIVAPSLPSQRRVASILSAYDDLIENNRRRIAILEEMARRIYEEWFVRFRFPGHEQVKMLESELGLIPEGWLAGRFQSLCKSVEDGDWIETKDQGGNDYRLLQISNVGVNSFVETGNFRYISSETFKRLRCREVLPGHILIARMPKPIGRAWLVTRQDWKMVTAVDVAVVEPDLEKTTPELLLHYLNSEATLAAFAGQASGTTRLRITRKQIEGMPIVHASVELARKFAEVVRPMNDLSTQLQRKNKVLRATRDLLLPKLISGELDVSTLPEPEEAIAA